MNKLISIANKKINYQIHQETYQELMKTENRTILAVYDQVFWKVYDRVDRIQVEVYNRLPRA